MFGLHPIYFLVKTMRFTSGVHDYQMKGRWVCWNDTIYWGIVPWATSSAFLCHQETRRAERTTTQYTLSHSNCHQFMEKSVKSNTESVTNKKIQILISVSDNSNKISFTNNFISWLYPLSGTQKSYECVCTLDEVM